MPQITILGAGIAGLSVGWLLQQRGYDYLILERQQFAGGLARSFEWHGFYCDFAAHRFFTSNEEVLQQILNLVPMGRQIRRSRIYMQGHWMRDPLDIIELSNNLSMTERLKLAYSYLFRQRNLAETNFEDYVLRKYGRYLYGAFFQPYTEKLFGARGDEISVLWALQKVRLSNPLDNFRENTKNKFQYFYYPIHGGYGAIADRLYQEVKGNVFLASTVTGIEVDEGKISHINFTKGGEPNRLPTDHVISTLPLSITTRMLGHSFNFQYQKVDAVYLWINKPQLTDLHWIYFIDKDIAINRMVEFKNMSPIDTPADTTVLCAEVTQQHPDPVTKVTDDLIRVGLVQEKDILDTRALHEEYAYPVYTNDYDKLVQSAFEEINHYPNLYVVGRSAEFRHREVDDNFATAMEIVDQVVQNMPGFGVQPMKEKIVTEEISKPKIIVVILCFNHYEDTYECLNSLLGSDVQDLKIVIVDNGSSDQTPEKVRRDYPNTYIIENGQNLGVPAGYNVGFRYALEHQADYILMLNNDTVIARDMINKLLEQAEQDPLTGIVMPKILYYGSNERVWSSGGRYRAFPPSILMTDTRKNAEQSSLRLIEFAPSCGLLIHRRAFERAGLFDPGYFFLFDDWDFSERVRAHGLHIWYLQDAVMWHKVSRTTRGPRSPLFWYTMGASIARFYRRHGRPAWLSLPVHIGYFAIREFFVKQNWKYWKDFWNGVHEGITKPLGSIPTLGRSP